MAVAPFGFSVGDFIAGIQLLAEVTQALRASSSVVVDYQSTIADLEFLQGVLRKVENLQQANTDEETADRIRLYVIGCQRPIAEFLRKIRKYEPSLLAPAAIGAWRSTRNFLRRAPKKVKWALWIQEDVARLKAAVAPQMSAIAMYVQLETVGSLSSLERIEAELVQHRNAVSQQPEGVSRQTIEPIEGGNTKPLNATQSLDLRIGCGQLEISLFLQMRGLKDSVEMAIVIVCGMIHVLYRISSAMNSIPRGPTLLLEDNVKLKDALGRVSSLLYDYVRSWSTVMARIRCEFEGLPGALKVKCGNFGLFTANGRQRLLHDWSWEQEVKPGSRVVMAMFIQDQGGRPTQCPRCGTASGTASRAGWVVCSECGLNHQPKSHEPENADDFDQLAMCSRGESEPLTQTEFKIEARWDEEETDMRYFKIVQWSTYPCEFCDAVYTLSSQLTRHETACHIID